MMCFRFAIGYQVISLFFPRQLHFVMFSSGDLNCGPKILLISRVCARARLRRDAVSAAGSLRRSCVQGFVADEDPLVGGGTLAFSTHTNTRAHACAQGKRRSISFHVSSSPKTFSFFSSSPSLFTFFSSTRIDIELVEHTQTPYHIHTNHRDRWFFRGNTHRDIRISCHVTERTRTRDVRIHVSTACRTRLRLASAI